MLPSADMALVSSNTQNEPIACSADIFYLDFSLLTDLKYRKIQVKYLVFNIKWKILR